MTRTSQIMAVFATLTFASSIGRAADEPAATAPASNAAAPAQTSAMTLELNKLETFDKGCRVFVVVNNPTDTAYQAYKLDLVMFRTDGVIGRQFALNLSPLKAQKKTVKQFDLDGIACDKIGSFLINDVIDCKTESGPAENCLQRLTTSTLTSVQLSK